MTTSEKPAFDLSGTYVDLKDGGVTTPIELTADFWAELESGALRVGGRLMGAFPLTGDMTHWEMHPAGDELLYLLSGAADILLEEMGGERRIALRAKEACIVPKGVWHRIIVRTPGELMFVTAGEGTQHRPL
ncbi:cupin domain-containing protein [Rhodospirillaceae bacterium SYSU D60014]|uniref:cupin domain-containing protein n=1 Tax=Virgifigura deserti TaxID=2268457 RepID=UPI000E664514